MSDGIFYLDIDWVVLCSTRYMKYMVGATVREHGVCAQSRQKEALTKNV